jgi:hypothetical protein
MSSSNNSKSNRRRNRNGRGYQGSNSKTPVPTPVIGSGPGPTSPRLDTSVLAESLNQFGGDTFQPPTTAVLDAIPEEQTVQRRVSFLTTPSAGSVKPDEEAIPTPVDEEDVPRLGDYDDPDDTPTIRSLQMPLAEAGVSQRQYADARHKTKPRVRSRRVSEEQSQVDSAELLWYMV